MSLGIRVGQRRQLFNQAQGAVTSAYGIAGEIRQGTRPSALMVQAKRLAGTSAHSITVEGAMDIGGPWEVLATITDELTAKVTKLPTYIRFNVGTSTGGNMDIYFEGAVN